MEIIIIKFVKKPYGREKDIQQLFCYIAGECDSKEEHARYCCGEVVSIEPRKAARQMIRAQKYRKKAYRRIYHYVVSFPLSMDDANCVKLAAMEIAYIFPGNIRFIMEFTRIRSILHIHYTINAVSYVNGKKWYKSRNEIQKMETQMRKRAKTVLGC